MTNTPASVAVVQAREPSFYVASRASLAERPAMWRRFRDNGVSITSTWIDEAGEGETACNAELWTRIEREVREADALVLYVEPDDFPLKGALIEVGMALAMGRTVYVCAPGVTLEPHTMRPLGSWSKHPHVVFVDDVAFPFAKHRLAFQQPGWEASMHADEWAISGMGFDSHTGGFSTLTLRKRDSDEEQYLTKHEVLAALSAPASDAALREVIAAARGCIAHYPVASGLIKPLSPDESEDGYGALRELRLAVEAYDAATPSQKQGEGR